jgi:uncharacterized DUF497 family protein
MHASAIQTLLSCVLGWVSIGFAVGLPATVECGSNDPRFLSIVDLEDSEAEEPWFSIGQASNGMMLSVVYLWIEREAATTIRMISARKATNAEIHSYRETL